MNNEDFDIKFNCQTDLFFENIKINFIVFVGSKLLPPPIKGKFDRFERASRWFVLQDSLISKKWNGFHLR